MQRKRLTQQDERRVRTAREAAHGAREQLNAMAHDSSREDLEGQLGPDELPDPSEVVMNREAKRRRG